MRAVLVAAAIVAVPFVARPEARDAEIQNVAAFARLYGVARYFYPSDAGAKLDWNRFAVHGVAQVRSARDARALAATLNALLAPLGPGIQVGAQLPPRAPVPSSAEPLVAWRYLGPGLRSDSNPYLGKRTHRASTPAIDGFITLMQTVPAEALSGKAVRLRGRVRADRAGSDGAAALWLRVDRPNRGLGFFDNMGSRPIREPQWREYAIEGSVSEDAVDVAFGVMARGAVTADFDAIELASRGDGDWTPIPIADAGFEAPAGDAAAAAWRRTGTSAKGLVSRPAESAPEGRQFLRFSPASLDAEGEGTLAKLAPTSRVSIDIELGAGLTARVPLALTDAEAHTAPERESRLDALSAALSAVPDSSAEPDLDRRLADVVVAWNVFRHFYPYWTEAATDWDAQLHSQLEAARVAKSRKEQRDALCSLVAGARDGHGAVIDQVDSSHRASLPLRLAVVQDQLVVTASAAPSEAPVGAVISSPLRCGRLTDRRAFLSSAPHSPCRRTSRTAAR
jgi:hypothetical protein